MKTAAFFAAILASAALCCGTALEAAQAASELKIAIVDMGKLFDEYYKTKINDANLKRQAEIFKDYSDKLNDSLQKLQDEFKTLRDSSQNIALTDVERENRRLAAMDKYREVTAKEAELRQYSRDKQRQLRDDFEKMRLEIIEEIKRVVRERCALEGYTLVIDKSGMTLNNIPAVIYYNPSMEITDGVLKDLNRGHENDGAPQAGAPGGDPFKSLIEASKDKEQKDKDAKDSKDTKEASPK